MAKTKKSNYYAKIENREGEDWLMIGNESGYCDIKISALDRDTMISFACSLIGAELDCDDIDIMERLNLIQEPDMD